MHCCRHGNTLENSRIRDGKYRAIQSASPRLGSEFSIPVQQITDNLIDEGETGIGGLGDCHHFTIPHPQRRGNPPPTCEHFPVGSPVQSQEETRPRESGGMNSRIWNGSRGFESILHFQH